MEVIKVTNLTKEFKIRQKGKGFRQKFKLFFAPKSSKLTAVNSISFSINEGEAVAFIGPNGAGKSTTIKMMTGILYPTSGEVSVLGLSPQKNRLKLCHEIGTVFGQKEQLWIHLTPLENFKFFGSIYNIKKDLINKRIGELTELFGIGDFLHQSVKSLSLGQRMKCEMVASLLHNPKVLFFDEPTIGLDILAKETLRELIKKINKELKVTVIFTSHDVGDIEDVCKRVIIINNGNIVLDDSMKNLRFHYMGRKQIELKLKQVPSVKFPDGMKLVKGSKTGQSLKMELDTEKVSVPDALRLFNEDDILDITIETMPLENIIKQIYKGESSGKIGKNNMDE